MRRLHLFFPENDLALAMNIAGYTPPPAATRLRRAGQTLGLWYGDAGDDVFDQGIDGRWYETIRSRYGLRTELFAGSTAGLTPAPWGWSKASRLFLERIGFSKDMLPDDAALDRIRELSHRRTAAMIGDALARTLPYKVASPAVELSSAENVRTFVEKVEHAVLKLPWSSSGRGLLFATPADVERMIPQIEGVIRRQGSIMGEKRYRRKLDFAMLFTMENGRCIFDGLSLFGTDANGAYTGNVLAPQEELASAIERETPPLAPVAEALAPILEEIIGKDYDGPLGIDMMAVDDGDVRLATAVELNLRMTMGHVARLFYERHVAEGRQGMFEVVTEGAGEDTASLIGTKISAGVLSLSAPRSPFSFRVRIQ